MNVTAIIVAKEPNARLQNKNMLKFGEGTVISHKINQLNQCKLVNQVVVGSNSENILFIYYYCSSNEYLLIVNLYLRFYKKIHRFTSFNSR